MREQESFCLKHHAEPCCRRLNHGRLQDDNIWDTLTSSDGKTQYCLGNLAPSLIASLTPDQWYSETELVSMGMPFIRTSSLDDKPRKWKLTTWARANIESGAWRA